MSFIQIHEFFPTERFFHKITAVIINRNFFRVFLLRFVAIFRNRVTIGVYHFSILVPKIYNHRINFRPYAFTGIVTQRFQHNDDYNYPSIQLDRPFTVLMTLRTANVNFS